MGARPLSSLRTEIARYVGKVDDDEALDLASSGIKSACGKLNRFVWKWALQFQDITFTADACEYPLDSFVKEPRRLMALDSSGHEVFRLGFKDFASFLEEHQNTQTQGDPCVYSIANIHKFGTLSLDVRPSTAWASKYPTGRLWYYRRIEPPNAPAEPADVPSEVEDFILWHAKALIASTYDKSKVDTAMMMATIAFKDLRFDNMVSSDWE